MILLNLHIYIYIYIYNTHLHAHPARNIKSKYLFHFHIFKIFATLIYLELIELKCSFNMSHLHGLYSLYHYESIFSHLHIKVYKILSCLRSISRPMACPCNGQTSASYIYIYIGLNVPEFSRQDAVREY